MWTPVYDVQVEQLNALVASHEVPIGTHVGSHIGCSSWAAQRACTDSESLNTYARRLLHDVQIEQLNALLATQAVWVHTHVGPIYDVQVEQLARRDSGSLDTYALCPRISNLRVEQVLTQTASMHSHSAPLYRIGKLSSY